MALHGTNAKPESGSKLLILEHDSDFRRFSLKPSCSRASVLTGDNRSVFGHGNEDLPIVALLHRVASPDPVGVTSRHRDARIAGLVDLLDRLGLGERRLAGAL